MLNSYTLYKKLETKIDNAIYIIKKENTNTVIRILMPMIIAYSYKPLKDDLLYIWIIIAFVCILFILDTFDFIHKKFTYFNDICKGLIFDILPINTNISPLEKDKIIRDFNENYSKYFKNLSLIYQITKKSSENRDIVIFLLFAEDEIIKINKILSKVQRLIDYHEISVDNPTNIKIEKLKSLFMKLIKKIENCETIKDEDKDLYERLINLSI